MRGSDLTSGAIGPVAAPDGPRALTGPDYLRDSLGEAANRDRRPDPTSAAFSAQKEAPSPRHPPQRALVLTARPLTRGVFARLRCPGVRRDAAVGASWSSECVASKATPRICPPCPGVPSNTGGLPGAWFAVATCYHTP